MSTILAIETSTRRSSVALLKADRVIYDSENEPIVADGFDLSTMVMRALNITGTSHSSIGGVAVDVGPGGLNAVRAGVTFANGLAISLAVPIFPANSLEIMAHEANAKMGLPVICVRGANPENALMAIYEKGKIDGFYSAPLSTLVDRARNLVDSHAVAGRFRKQFIRELSRLDFLDSDIEHPTAVSLLNMISERGMSSRSHPSPVEIIYPEAVVL